MSADQVTREDVRGCRTIGCRTLKELDEETRGRDVVAGPYQRDLPGYGRQHYAYVRMTDAERRHSAATSVELIKEFRALFGASSSYVAEIAAECEALGVPVDFDLE